MQKNIWPCWTFQVCSVAWISNSNQPAGHSHTSCSSKQWLLL